MEQNIIYFDRPTINGRTYTAKCFASLPETLLVTMGIDLNAVCGKIDHVVLTGDFATVYWRTLATPMGRLFDLMPLPRSYGFSPVGSGVLDGGQVIKYQLNHFAIIHNGIWSCPST